MIVFLLLVIVAILLFGSSRVIGAAGMALGGCTTLLALFFGIYAIGRLTDTEPGDVLMHACFAILPLAILAGLMGVGTKTPRPGPMPTVEEINPVPRFHSNAPSREERKRLRGR